MKKKILTVLAVVLAAAVLYVGDMFLGNPVSRLLVKVHSEKYIRETYPAELQLELSDIYYDWYSGGAYEIKVTSPVSEDTVFMLRYSRLGRLIQDTYEMYVASGDSTLWRLHRDYEERVSNALDGLWENVIWKSGLSFLDPYSGQPVPLDVGIDPAQLILDGEYDAAQLGNVYGYLDINIYEPTKPITVETVAEYLGELKNAMEESCVGFVELEVFLIRENTKVPEESLYLEKVTREDLEGEELPKILGRKVVK